MQSFLLNSSIPTPFVPFSTPMFAFVCTRLHPCIISVPTQVEGTLRLRSSWKSSTSALLLQDTRSGGGRRRRWYRSQSDAVSEVPSHVSGVPKVSLLLPACGRIQAAEDRKPPVLASGKNLTAGEMERPGLFQTDTGLIFHAVHLYIHIYMSETV